MSAVHKLSNAVGVTVRFEKNIVTDNDLDAWACMFVGSARVGRGILFGLTQSTGRQTDSHPRYNLCCEGRNGQGRLSE